MATQETMRQEIAKKNESPSTFPAMLKAFLPEIERALPKHMNGDRISRIALTCFRQNPKLAECDPKTVFACVIQSSQLGLELGLSGRAFMVPYKGIATFVPGWRGLVELANRTGRASVWTGAVYEGDEFEYQLGDSPYLKHRPSDNEGTLTHVYAIGRVKGSDWPIVEVWPIKKVLKHRDRYNKVGPRHYSFENEELYARKIPLLQVLKYMPSSSELETAIALNDAAELGNQNLTVKEAIEGTWAPSPEEEAPKTPAPPATTPAPIPATATPEMKMTYAQVADAINKSRTSDELFIAADLITAVPDKVQQSELAGLYKKRERELIK